MPTTAREFARESVPVAIVLFAWFALSALGGPNGEVQSSIRIAGIVMALLYAVLRGRSLAAAARPAYRDRTPEGVLRENGRAILAAGPWFLGAIVVEFLRDLLQIFEFNRVVSAVVDVLAYTGLLTVVLVAIATGVAAYRSGRQV